MNFGVTNPCRTFERQACTTVWLIQTRSCESYLIFKIVLLKFQLVFLMFFKVCFYQSLECNTRLYYKSDSVNFIPQIEDIEDSLSLFQALTELDKFVKGTLV